MWGVPAKPHYRDKTANSTIKSPSSPATLRHEARLSCQNKYTRISTLEDIEIEIHYCKLLRLAWFQIAFWPLGTETTIFFGSFPPSR